MFATASAESCRVLTGGSVGLSERLYLTNACIWTRRHSPCTEAADRNVRLMTQDTGNTEKAELRVNFDAYVCSDDMPHTERTRAGGEPWRRPDGWHHSEVVAAIIECVHQNIVTVDPDFEVVDGSEGWVRFDATVIDNTGSVDDARIEIVTRFTPDGSPDHEGNDGETTTEQFSLDDALDNL